MDKIFKSRVLFFLILCFFASSSYAQTCSNYVFSNANQYTTCNALPVLNSFLHWNYHQSNNTVDIAYRHTSMTTSNWIVWALNPTQTRMEGSQGLVALFNSTGNIYAYTSPIPTYSTQLEQGNLSFSVPAISAEFAGSNEMIIYATIELPNAGSTTYNQVWQYGSMAGTRPNIHETTGDNLRSFGTIDFSTGRTQDTGAAALGSRNRKRNIHGVLNVVSWGIMMPIGAMIARYLKVFKSANPAWFYLHITCQASAYIIGVAGWGTGLKLGKDSPGIEQTTHRNIGITLFALGTLQVFALLLRPKPDHKYRLYWNIYHIGIGYTVVILTIINILEGFDILDAEKKWKNAYIGVLIALGAAAAILEAFTWYIVIKRKRNPELGTPKYTNGGAVNGVNGSYGA